MMPLSATRSKQKQVFIPLNLGAHGTIVVLEPTKDKLHVVEWIIMDPPHEVPN